MAVAESIFGNIYTGAELEVAVLKTLKRWFPTYIVELERQMGRELNQIPRPRQYTTRNEFESLPEDLMPIVIAISSGVIDVPHHDGEGVYRAPFGIGVGVITTARDSESAAFLARFYGAVIRAILLHKPTLRDENDVPHASAIDWVDENYETDPQAFEDLTVKTARLIFAVWVDDVVTRFGGPTHPTEPDPDTQPGSQWPTADTIQIEVVI